MKAGPVSILSALVLSVSLGAAPFAFAQAPAPGEVASLTGAPPELAQWSDWVLHGQVGYRCAYRDGARGTGPASRACVSVSPMEVDTGPQGTRFRFEALLDEVGKVPLPAASGVWPSEVSVNGQPATLSKDAQGAWSVVLNEGRAVVEGSWPTRLGQFQAPALFAHARHLRTGQALAVENGTVWVEGQPLDTSSPPQETVAPAAQVWRLLEDAAVPRLTTRVSLTVPEPERLVLGPVLPEGFEPVSWTSNAQLSLLEDGTIHVQAVRGHLTIELVARCTHACITQPEEALPPLSPPTPAQADGPWPSSEVWSFQASPTFRHLTASAPGVDPAAAGVPGPWAHLPAFRLTPSQSLSFRTVSRGPGAVQGEGLTLWRRMWATPSQWLQLDLLHGSLPAPSRLAMSPPHRLESAHSPLTPLPLTLLEEGGEPGIQWPTTQVELLAQSARGSSQPLTPGWNQTVSDMHVLMHLPVGNVLLAAPGNQNRGAEWIDHFTLLRFFGIALLGFIMFQLRHHRLLLTPLAVLLAAGWVHHGAAQTLLILIGGAGALLIIATALSAGRARSVVRVLATGLMGLALLGATPFFISQAHHLLYPDHQPHRIDHPHAFHQGAASGLGSALLTGLDFAQSMRTAHGQQQVAEVHVIHNQAPGSNRASSDSFSSDMAHSPPPPPAPQAPGAPDLQRDPLAGLGLARAGTALPQWPVELTNTYVLHYPGPLLPQSTDSITFPLWVMPSWATWLARLAGSIGLLVLLAGLVQRLYWEWKSPQLSSPGNDPRPQAKGPGRSLASMASVITVLGLLVPTFVAHAQQPVPQPPSAHAATIAQPSGLDAQLQELQRRLTAPPQCAPTCATLTHVDLEAGDTHVHATFHVSALSPTTWSMPSVRGGLLESARVAGATGLFDGPRLRLPEGRSRVEVAYLIQTDPFVLEFAHSPLAATQHLGEKWASEGLDAHGRFSSATGASWVLRRAQSQTQSDQRSVPLPASTSPVVLAHLERGFDFSRSVSIDYRLSRLDPVGRALTVSWPKLPGESVDSDRIEDRGQRWEATLSANEPELVWRATLPSETSELVVESLPATVGQETWRVSSSPSWELDVEGVPSTQASDRGDVTLLPLPGETLVLKGRRLSVMDGPTQRLDKVHVSTSAGTRMARHTLELEAFTTQAGAHSLGLPSNATLVSVSRNGQALPLPLENGRLEVPLERGEQQVSVVFQTPVSNALLQAPSIEFDGRAANLHWTLEPGERRWVLFAGGPGAGPAIFYWPLLVVFLVLAWAVSRLPSSPVSFRTALLLTLGLSMLPHTLVMLASLVAWLWLIRYRQGLDVDEMSPPRFRALQIGFVLLTAWCALLVLGNLGWGLIGASPDMMIEGYDGQRHTLSWYLASSDDGGHSLPWVFSLPVWVYQAILLAWSLWFTAWLFSVGKRALVAFTQGGHWRGRSDSSIPPPPST